MDRRKFFSWLTALAGVAAAGTRAAAAPSAVQRGELIPLVNPRASFLAAGASEVRTREIEAAYLARYQHGINPGRILIRGR